MRAGTDGFSYETADVFAPPRSVGRGCFNG